MKINVIAIRYARALLKLMGTSESVLNLNLQILEKMTSLFSIHEAVVILKSPVMPRQLKSDLLALAYEKDKTPALFLNFIGEVLNSGRTTLIPEIFFAYKLQIDDHQQVLHAQVTSAKTMKHDQESDLRKELELIFKKKIIMSQGLNPALLGGFIAKIGHFQIDCSLKTKIENAISNAAAISGA